MVLYRKVFSRNLLKLTLGGFSRQVSHKPLHCSALLLRGQKSFFYRCEKTTAIMQGVAKYYKDKIAHQKGSDIKRKEGLLRTKRIKSVNKYLASLGLGILFSFCIIIIIIYLSILCACVCVYVCRAITVNLNIVVEDTFSKLTSLEIALKRAKEKQN